MAQTEFKRGDRVKRRDVAGPLGTVQNIRIESIRSSLKHDSSGEGPGVNVTVLWDNGTLSHFIPEGLERV